MVWLNDFYLAFQLVYCFVMEIMLSQITCCGRMNHSFRYEHLYQSQREIISTKVAALPLVIHTDEHDLESEDLATTMDTVEGS